MEETYAQALWEMAEKGMNPKKAVEALRETLEASGRAALMPRIARAFARIAAREERRSRVTLSVAHEKDASRAKSAAKQVLAELDVKSDDVEVSVDDSLIGGWRLEGREHLIDASWKTHLLSIYNHATQ